MGTIEDARAALTRDITALVYGDNNFPERDLSLATKIADLAIERLTAPPTDDEREWQEGGKHADCYHGEHVCATTDDEREALVTKAYNTVTGNDDESWNPDTTLGALYALYDSARRQGPITDAQVKALGDTLIMRFHHFIHDEAPIDAIDQIARAALEAARDAS